MSLNLILQRYSDNGDSTQGLLHAIEGNSLRFLNYTLEDEFREVKIKGETCIPNGLYEVTQRKVLSPMTKHYRTRFAWFDWHLELQGVEGFEHIYIHVGNKDENTDGCILVQDNANNNTVTKGFNGSSVPAFERLYNLIRAELNNGSKVFIRVRKISHLL